jgi:hypothetical protein
MMPHFNQLLREAAGEYYMLLLDDDEISSNYVSELVRMLEKHPEASSAFSRQEVIDLSGAVLRRSKNHLPEILSGPDFIRAVWQRNEFRFKSVSTFLARTERMRAGGGYPEFTKGTHPDNALAIQMCLDNYVVFSSNCVWRNRSYESSHGMSIPISCLAAATKEFIAFLDQDPIITRFASEEPVVWAELRSALVQMAWQTYFYRWDQTYKSRLPFWRWALAAFAMRRARGFRKRTLRAILEECKNRIPSPASGWAQALPFSSSSRSRPSISSRQ